MIDLSHLTKRFGSIAAVDDLSIAIASGEVFGLLGPNGAGKTTTVNLAVGLLRPDSGSVKLARLGPPSSAKVRAKIGVAPQALALYDNLSGEENLRFFGRMQGLSGQWLSERVTWALDFVQLSDRRRDRVKTYSGGMKRRLNLAVALIHDPPILFLDEPTVGVDPQSRNAVFQNIEAMRKEGRTIVYTTHYMEEAERLCDRVGIMDRGKLLALDSVDNLIAAHGGKTVIIAECADGETRIETDDPMSELAAIQQGKRPLRLRVERPDLEGVFLNLTGRHLRDN
ncbi:MAG: ABC transporter ATP-binding protein [Candidatus Eisenbacteria bacterium]